MHRPIVILNPAAKGEKAGQMQRRIEALHPKPVIRLTAGPGDAEALAERAVEQGYTTIIAAGGDGTVNEVVNGMAGSDASLGLLPSGTMNVFATELGLPPDLAACWKVIQEGHTRLVDLPKVNDQHFVQLAGVGFDAQIVLETERDFRKNFGPLSYLVVAAQIAARTPPRLRVELPDGTTYQGSFVLIGNGRHYGGPFVFFKNAKIDDRKLDVMVFGKTGHIDILRYLQGIFFGDPAAMKDVDYFQTSKLQISCDTKVPLEVDGELAGFLPAHFSIARKKLRVFTPQA